MNEDMQKELEEICLDIMLNKRQSKLDEIKKMEDFATGACIGCVVCSLINYLMGATVVIIGTSFTAVYAGLLAIVCRLSRKYINKKTEKDANVIADNITSSFERLFANFDKAFYIEPDDDSVLRQKIDLLTAYAQEVGYPDYKVDISLIEEIIQRYLVDEITSHEITLLIKNMEQLMLDKAYKFYTGRLGRKRHLRGKLL